jgi:ferric-dicitrate binding protein FerR (iron transport regulator)
VAVKPAANSWTEFQVTDVDGRVQIAANKGDVTVQEDKGTTTVSEGQQTTRDHTNDVEKRNGISAKVRVRPRGRRVEF